MMMNCCNLSIHQSFNFLFITFKTIAHLLMKLSSPSYKGHPVTKVVRHDLNQHKYCKTTALVTVFTLFVTAIRFNVVKLNKEHNLYKHIHSENGCRVMYLLWLISLVLLARCFQVVCSTHAVIVWLLLIHMQQNIANKQ